MVVREIRTPERVQGEARVVADNVVPEGPARRVLKELDAMGSIAVNRIVVKLVSRGPVAQKSAA